MKKVLSTLLAATLLLTTVTGLQGLSVSAEDGAAAGTSNELIANGNFEGADTVLLEDDFEGYNKGNNTNPAWNTAIKIQEVADENGQTNKVLNIQSPVMRKVSLRPNKTYTLSLRIKGDPAQSSVPPVYQFLAKISVDARGEDGKLNWDNVFNATPDLVTIASWQQLDGTVWYEYSKSFTTSADLDTSVDYYFYGITSWRALIIDDLKLVEKFEEQSNAVNRNGVSLVTAPNDNDNHCLKLTQWNVPEVKSFAVESNTFYKFSYKYKQIASTDKTSNFYCSIYAGTDLNDRVLIFDKNGEVKSGWGPSAFNCGAKLSSAADDWQESFYIFKTGEVDSSKSYTLRMTVTDEQMYADDFSVTKLVSDTAVRDGFDFLGTAIRSEKEYIANQELRFKARVKKEALTAGHYNGFTVIEYGFLAFRKDYLANQDSQLTMNVEAKKGDETKTVAVLTKEAYKVDSQGKVITDIVFKDEGDTKQFHARLTSFNPETNYDKTYLVRTYAKLKNAAGVELTVYLSGTEELGVYDLAYAVLNNQAEDVETRQNMWDLLNTYYKGSDYAIGNRPE